MKTHHSLLIVGLLLLEGCTAPVDQPKTYAAATIGPSGGSVGLGAFSITIPPNALKTETSIVIRQMDLPDLFHYSVLSPHYSIEPASLVLAAPLAARYEFTDALPLRQPSFFWSLFSKWPTDHPERIDTQIIENAARGKAIRFSEVFVGVDDACQDKDLGWYCEDSQHLIACNADREVQSRTTCNCAGDGGKAQCNHLDWVGAPWPVGTCLTLVQGYDGWMEGVGDSHLHLLDERKGFAADFQDPHDCEATVFATCSFPQCRINPGCRSAASIAEAERWGVDACVEALDEQGNPTGEWQFISQLANLATQAQEGLPLLRGETIGLMGSSGFQGAGNQCGGKRFHLEQGPTVPIGESSAALPIDFLLNQNASPMKVCSAPLPPNTVERTAILESPSRDSQWFGAITIRGRARDSTGLDLVEVVVGAKGVETRIELCSSGCGTKYSFEATLNPVMLGIKSPATLSIGLRLRGQDGGTSVFPTVDIEWEKSNANLCAIGTAGPEMVRIPAPSAPDGTMCIDRTEVTNGDYAKFLAATNGGADVGIEDLGAACAQNSTYMPDSGWPPSSARMNRPVVFVDWCDAYAYCKWANKRLCGRIGGGPLEPWKSEDAAASQWMNACSASGANDFPYGDQNRPSYCYTTSTCNVTNCPTLNVASKPLCQAAPPYDGVYDLVGNVSEWEDACSSIGNCNVRGSHSDTEGPCGAITYAGRWSTGNFLGFRCCGP